MTSPIAWQRSLLAKSLTVLVIAACVNGVAPAGETKPQQAWKVPRTLDGQPDLQGNWTNTTLPRERLQKYGERSSLTAEEAKEIENSEAGLARRDAAPTDPSKGIYVHACHERNYAPPGMLAGAREAERAVQSK